MCVSLSIFVTVCFLTDYDHLPGRLTVTGCTRWFNSLLWTTHGAATPGSTPILYQFIFRVGYSYEKIRLFRITIKHCSHIFILLLCSAVWTGSKITARSSTRSRRGCRRRGRRSRARMVLYVFFKREASQCLQIHDWIFFSDCGYIWIQICTQHFDLWLALWTVIVFIAYHDIPIHMKAYRFACWHMILLRWSIILSYNGNDAITCSIQYTQCYSALLLFTPSAVSPLLLMNEINCPAVAEKFEYYKWLC